jgi:hypothetical protein
MQGQHHALSLIPRLRSDTAHKVTEEPFRFRDGLNEVKRLLQGTGDPRAPGFGRSTLAIISQDYGTPGTELGGQTGRFLIFFDSRKWRDHPHVPSPCSYSEPGTSRLSPLVPLGVPIGPNSPQRPTCRPPARKLIHRESFRASVLHHSDSHAVLLSIAAKKRLLTTPSLLSRGTAEEVSGVRSGRGWAELHSATLCPSWALTRAAGRP